MYEQLSKELKASLFQRIKSPFFGSFLIGLFIFNYRFLLILLSNKSLEDKFNLIDTTNLIMNLNPLKIPIINSQIEPIYLTTLIYPFLFALFYIGIVPFFEYYISMPIWKKHQNRLKEKYAKLECEEIFLGKEKSKYLDEILNLKKEKNKLVEELTDIDLANQSKIDNVKKEKDEEYKKEKEKLYLNFEIELKNQGEALTKQYEMMINEKEKKNEEKIKESELKKDNISKNTIKENQLQISKKDIEINQLNERIFSSESLISRIEDTLTSIKNENILLKKELEKYEEKEKIKNQFYDEKYKKYLEKYTTEELNIFKIIYDLDIKDKRSITNFVDEIIKNSDIKRIHCEYVIDILIKKDLIRRDSLGNIVYQASLKELIFEIFNNRK